MTWWEFIFWISVYWQCSYLMILLTMKVNDERFKDRKVAVKVFFLSPFWPPMFFVMVLVGIIRTFSKDK